MMSRENFPSRYAAYPAAAANNIDLERIAGRTAVKGIPYSMEFMRGESTAVSNPTRHPYL